MPLMLPAQGLLESVDDASAVELPPRFAEALEHVRAVIARCDKAGIPNYTLLAALMTGCSTSRPGLQTRWCGVDAQSACSRTFERRIDGQQRINQQ